jgi:hypothetical protein
MAVIAAPRKKETEKTCTRWRIVVRDPATGKQDWRTVYGSRAAAERAERRMRVAIDDGGYVSSRKSETVADAVQKRCERADAAACGLGGLQASGTHNLPSISSAIAETVSRTALLYRQTNKIRTLRGNNLLYCVASSRSSIDGYCSRYTGDMWLCWQHQRQLMDQGDGTWGSGVEWLVNCDLCGKYPWIEKKDGPAFCTRCKQVSRYTNASAFDGVYVISAVGTGFIKVGTTCDIASRLKALQASCPLPLNIELFLKTPFCGKDVEKIAHQYLQQHRLRKRQEWFEATIKQGCDAVLSAHNEFLKTVCSNAKKRVDVQVNRESLVNARHAIASV